MSNQYDLERLHAAGLVRQIEHHAEIGSTNDRALRLAESADAVFPLLVLADRQTTGRGRGANQWWAAEGSLTFTLVVESSAANVPAHRWPQLSLTTGLAICQAIELLTGSVDAQVKWPNDVYLLERKACGILIETPRMRNRLAIGVGLNVNNSFRDAPSELQSKAVSLLDYDGQRRDLTVVTLLVLERIESCWKHLAEHGFSALIDQWRARSYLTGRTVQLISGPQILTGRCLGIDDDGALLLQTESGLRRCHAGSIVSVE